MGHILINKCFHNNSRQFDSTHNYGWMDVNLIKMKLMRK